MFITVIWAASWVSTLRQMFVNGYYSELL